MTLYVHADDNGHHATLVEKGGFDVVVPELKNGYRARREGWNGKHQYIFMVEDGTYASNAKIGPFIAICTEQKTIIPWLCSQGDLLADDWIVE